MKKAAILILTILYITSASGATVNIHYCMGQFAGWELGHDDEQSCGSCGMDKQSKGKEDCCRDEHKTLKVDDVHKMAESFVQLVQAPVIITEHNNMHGSYIMRSGKKLLPSINAPPSLVPEHVYLVNRSIRI